MPRAAIGTGIVDLILPPDRMPEALVSLARQPYVREPDKPIEEATPDDQLKALLTIVRARTRQDFSGCRKRTLLRRIYRRMGLHQIDSLSSYAERLRTDPGEVKALAADLTINVTGFFREPQAWDMLAAKVIGPLVRERPADSTIRVWVPGCSTGEEAYSIAMLIAEQAQAAHKSFEAKLFATDVAAGVLPAARSGIFPGSIAADIGEERLKRFFEVADDTCLVNRTLRDMITFAPQNLLQDPPFSRLDLITCRNLLIYLEPELQRRVLRLFHFALREGGHLFLGSAETVAGQEDLFHAVSKKVADLPAGRVHAPRRGGLSADRERRSGARWRERCAGGRHARCRQAHGRGAARALRAGERAGRPRMSGPLPAWADRGLPAPPERRAVLQPARHGARGTAGAPPPGGPAGARPGWHPPPRPSESSGP
jgi:two-component system CheB/CheR fusion protein